MPAVKGKRKPVKEAVGWAIVEPSGRVVMVSPHSRSDVIRQFVDPSFDLGEDGRKASWATWKSGGLRIVKVRISEEPA